MRLAAATILIALAVCGCSARAAPNRPAAPVSVEAITVPLNPQDPSAVRRGGFVYAGGLQLKGVDTDQFGGLSDLRVGPDGALTAVSDEGRLLRARLTFDSQGRLDGLGDARMTPLAGLDGQPVQGKTEGDSEGLALWPNGDLMVSFERDHRVWIYPAGGGPPRPAPRPDTPMPDNEGMEGLALSPSHGPDAYWVGIEGGSIWLCHLQGGCARDDTQVQPPLGYRLTALSETAQGDLVVLHQGWDPVRGSHIILWITRPRPGRPTRILAKLSLAKPYTVDGFEGVDAQALPGGGLRLYLISDDNFSANQRTLLLAFDWRGRRGQR